MGYEPNTQQGQIDAWKSECEARSRAELANAHSAACRVQGPTRASQRPKPRQGEGGGGSFLRRLFWLSVVGMGGYWWIYGSLPPVPWDWLEEVLR